MATSAVSSDSLPVAPPASSCLDKISSLAKIIYECAVRIIFIATSILITAYLFPVGFHAVVLPVVGLSSTITSAFFFRKSSTRSGEISNPPPLMRPLALPPGLEREGNNCA